MSLPNLDCIEFLHSDGGSFQNQPAGQKIPLLFQLRVCVCIPYVYIYIERERETEREREGEGSEV